MAQQKRARNKNVWFMVKKSRLAGGMWPMTWIDRTLLLGPRVAVVTSERQFLRVAQSLGVADAAGYVGDGWLGAVHAYDVAGELVCVVGLNLQRLAQLDGIDVAAVIVHEAVHVSAQQNVVSAHIFVAAHEKVVYHRDYEHTATPCDFTTC